MEQITRIYHHFHNKRFLPNHQEKGNAARTVWSRNLPQNVKIVPQVRWPVWLIPFVFLNQLLAPHPVWLVLLVTLVGLYALGYLWVREQALGIELERKREGMLLVSGDTLQESFELRNRSLFPLLWAELHDQSDLPDYRIGRVVACAAQGFYRWHLDQTCGHRGLYKLGPSRLQWSDPFGLFLAQKHFEQSEDILIYPRVAQLPDFEFAQGSASGSHRQRRPLLGSIRSASVREYQSGDSLRHIHWPSTAHRNRFMVTELDTEPGGEVWIVLNLDAALHQGDGETSTLEYGIVVAASLASQLLNSHQRQAVGLITASAGAADGRERHRERHGELYSEPRVVAIPPQVGQSQLWRILAALAPVQTVDLSLASLLKSSQHLWGRRRTLVVITPLVESARGNVGVGEATPDTRSAVLPETASDAALSDAILFEKAYDWIADLLYVREQAGSSVLLVAQRFNDQTDSQTDNPQADNLLDDTGFPLDLSTSADEVQKILARHNVPCKVLYTDDALRPLLTYRRTRKVVRSTPSGGAVMVEVEEEVG